MQADHAGNAQSDDAAMVKAGCCDDDMGMGGKSNPCKPGQECSLRMPLFQSSVSTFTVIMPSAVHTAWSDPQPPLAAPSAFWRPPRLV
jgi:hypothetical protein